MELISEVTDIYLAQIEEERSFSTFRIYRNALLTFLETVEQKEICSKNSPISAVSSEWISHYASKIQDLSPATKHVYLTAIYGWYEFLVQEKEVPLNLSQLRRLIQKHSDYQYEPSPVLDYEISRVIDYVNSSIDSRIGDEKERLRLYRDRALILLLADTGLDVQAIYGLERNDFNTRRKRLKIKGKGYSTNVRLSTRSHEAISDYLEMRLEKDVATGENISFLPIFARHDRGAGKKILGITTVTARNIVRQYVHDALGVESVGKITPRSLKQYFVTSVLQRSFDFLHPKIIEKCHELFETGQYEAAIFNAMKVVEEEVRTVSSSDPSDYGRELIMKAMRPSAPKIIFSSISAEQESAFFLYSGAIGSFKNPSSHRFIDKTDPVKSYECLAFASLLLRMMEEVT